MAEYIEREALTAELAKGTIITDDIYGMGIMAGIDFAIKTARSIPAADVVEVRHGRWVSHDLEVTFSCSECDFTTDFRLSNYCPNCGARMGGE